MKFLIILLLCYVLWSADGTLIGGDLCQRQVSGQHARDAFTAIEGETFNVSRKAVIESGCGFATASSLIDRAMIGYCNVNFGQGAKAIQLRISVGSSADRYPLIARLYLDRLSGTPLATFSLQRVGDWCQFVEWKVFLSYIPTGVRNLYFLFSADPKNPGVGVFNLDWFQFTNTV